MDVAAKGGGPMDGLRGIYIGIIIALIAAFLYDQYAEPKRQVVVVQQKQRYVPCPSRNGSTPAAYCHAH